MISIVAFVFPVCKYKCRLVFCFFFNQKINIWQQSFECDDFFKHYDGYWALQYHLFCVIVELVSDYYAFACNHTHNEYFSKPNWYTFYQIVCVLLNLQFFLVWTEYMFINLMTCTRWIFVLVNVVLFQVGDVPNTAWLDKQL